MPLAGLIDCFLGAVKGSLGCRRTGHRCDIPVDAEHGFIVWFLRSFRLFETHSSSTVLMINNCLLPAHPSQEKKVRRVDI